MREQLIHQCIYTWEIFFAHADIAKGFFFLVMLDHLTLMSTDM